MPDCRQHHRNQSRRPEWIETTPRSYDVTFDLKANRYRMLMGRSGMRRELIYFLEVFDGKERVSANLALKTKSTRPVQQACSCPFSTASFISVMSTVVPMQPYGVPSGCVW
jgi:hypothetical protein